MAETMKLAHRIAGNAPVALRMLKKSMLHGIDMPMEAALEYERAMIGLVFDSDDAHEGCSAFVEKRQPHFVGRTRRHTLGPDQSDSGSTDQRRIARAGHNSSP